MKKKLKKIITTLKKHLSQLCKTVSFIRKKTNNSRIFILLDIVWCFVAYSASYNEYRIFEFYSINHLKRKTYLTKLKKSSITNILNNPKYMDILKNKRKFYLKFNDYLKRNVYDIKEMSFKESELFIKENPEIICTSYDFGSKYEKLNVENYRSSAFMLEHMKNNKLNIMEAILVEHKAMKDINPYSMNYISIVTLFNNDNIHIVFASAKFGTKSEYIYDIENSNPIMGKIDIKSGLMYPTCKDESGKSYSEHPVSKIKFDGYKIPKFNDALKLAKSLAKSIPEIKQVEWKMIITKNGPVVIEGGEWNDYYFAQIPENNKSRIGLIPYYLKKLK